MSLPSEQSMENRGVVEGQKPGGMLSMSCGGSWVELPAAPVSEALVACSVACKAFDRPVQSCADAQFVLSENVLKDRIRGQVTERDRHGMYPPKDRQRGQERGESGKCTVPFTSGNLYQLCIASRPVRKASVSRSKLISISVAHQADKHC